jgi:hypothetical protein
MILMLAALAKLHGRSDLAVAHGAMVHRWAKYLVEHGPNPVTQLCTDDFAGHLAGNVNLALKAAAALAAYRNILEPSRSSETRRRRSEGALPRTSSVGRSTRRNRGSGSPSIARERRVRNTTSCGIVCSDSISCPPIKSERSGPRRSPCRGLRRASRRSAALHEGRLVPLDRRDGAGLGGVFEAMVKPLRKFFHETPDRVPMTDWLRTASRR